jgi:hypothetical protein
MRYAWDLYHQYLEEAGLTSGFKGRLAQYFLHKLRIWDYVSANRVDHYVANSEYPYTVGCFRGVVDPANYGATPLPLLGQKPPMPGMSGMGG